MSYFKAKMHQIRLMGLRPRPCSGSLQRFPTAPSCTSKEREGREGKGRGGKEKERIGEGKGGEGCPQLGSLNPPVELRVIRPWLHVK